MTCGDPVKVNVRIISIYNRIKYNGVNKVAALSTILFIYAVDFAVRNSKGIRKAK
jgi:hypothetical protein